MKTMVSFAFLFLIATAHVVADAPSLGDFTTVTNLWYEGHKSNVLAIAEQRLAANSNDLAGLILKMEYDLEFMNVSNYSNGIIRVLEVSRSITNECFACEKPLFEMALLDFLDYVAHRRRLFSLEEEAQERAKAAIIHKPMTYEIPLKALHDDGLF